MKRPYAKEEEMTYETIKPMPGVPAGTHVEWDKQTEKYYTIRGKMLVFEKDAVENEPDWFKLVPCKPDPIYPIMTDERYSVKFNVDFTLASEEDCCRFRRLVDSLYIVFQNRRNIEVGAATFSEDRWYIDYDTNGFMDLYTSKAKDFDGNPHKYMAEDWARFLKILFNR